MDDSFDPTQYGAVAVAEPEAFDPTQHGAIPVQQPDQPSGFEKVIGAAQTGLGYAQKTVQAAMNPVGEFHKLMFPEEAKLTEQPLISAPTLTSIVHGLQTPQRAILKGAFGDTGERLSEASGRFLGEQLSGLTSPENLALLAVEPAIGKLGGIKPPPVPKNLAEVAGITKPDIAQPIEPVATDAVVQPQQVATDQIRMAAVKLPNDAVYTGAIHADALRNAEESVGSELNSGAVQHGFVTESGRFLDNAEAMRHAVDTGQINKAEYDLQGQGVEGYISPTNLEAGRFNQLTSPVPAAEAATTVAPLPQESLAPNLPTGTGEVSPTVDDVVAKYVKTGVKADEPPIKGKVFRVMSQDEWNHVSKGGENWSGGFWSSDPSEYSGHLGEGDVLSVAPTYGPVQYQGLPKPDLIESGRQHYNNTERRNLNEISEAYQVQNGKLVKIHEQTSPVQEAPVSTAAPLSTQTEGEPNATKIGQESQSSIAEHPGVPQGSDLPAHGEEVRQVTGERTGDSGSTQPATQEQVTPPHIIELQSAADKTAADLEALGPEPYKPSPEKRYFGTRGREGAKLEDVQFYDEKTKAYNSWKRQYSKLQKQNLEASNELFRAKREETITGGYGPSASKSVLSTQDAMTQALDLVGKNEFDSLLNERLKRFGVEKGSPQEATHVENLARRIVSERGEPSPVSLPTESTTAQPLQKLPQSGDKVTWSGKDRVVSRTNPSTNWVFFEDGTSAKLSKNMTSPVPEAKAATTAEPIQKTPETSGIKEPTPATVPTETGETPTGTGISSERFSEAYGDSAPVANTGKGAGAWKDEGLSRLDNFQKTGDVKDDPYSVLTNLREGRTPVSQYPSDVALLGSEHQRLLEAARNAEGTPEYAEKSQAALDMANAIKEVAHGPASDVFRALQEYDAPRYDNVTDFDQALRERENRESTPTEKEQFKKVAKDVETTRDAAAKEVDGAQKQINKYPRMSFDDAFKNIHEQISELTKNCVL